MKAKEFEAHLDMSKPGLSEQLRGVVQVVMVPIVNIAKAAEMYMGCFTIKQQKEIGESIISHLESTYEPMWNLCKCIHDMSELLWREVETFYLWEGRDPGLFSLSLSENNISIVLSVKVFENSRYVANKNFCIEWKRGKAPELFIEAQPQG